MAGFAILLAFNFLGLLLRTYGHIPLPENVLGMILLLLALWTRLVRVEWVEASAGFLLHNMMLFFAPFIVAVIPLVDVIGANLLPIAGGLLASTFVTMLATSAFAQLLVKPRGAADAA